MPKIIKTFCPSRKIKSPPLKYEGRINLYLALGNTNTKCYSYKKGVHKFNLEYVKKFHALIGLVEHHGGIFIYDNTLTVIEEKKISKYNTMEIILTTEMPNFNTIARDKAMTDIFIEHYNRNKYSALLDDLENRFS